MRKYPSLTPLVLLLKQFLYERGLNNTYTGGLSSYCLTLMIVSFLQLNTPEKPKKKGMNWGKDLLNFLHYFGTKFDFDTTGISLSNGGYSFIYR